LNHTIQAGAPGKVFLALKIMTKEGAVVQACLEYLKLYGAFAWRNNTGALKDKSDRPVFFGKIGSADIIGLLPGGRFLAVECKTEKGKLSDKQYEFLTSVKEMGGLAFVARSVDDLMEGLKKRDGKIA